MRKSAMVACMALTLGACGQAPSQETSEPEVPVEEATASPAVFPTSLVTIGSGYPQDGDPCRRLGESAATIDWLDDSATLVGCISPEAAAELGGYFMGEVDGITIVSIAFDDANEGMSSSAPMQSPVARPKKDAAGSLSSGQNTAANSLERTCRAAVEKTTGAKVLNTISSEFSEAGTLFRFTVEGADAPWQCIGYSNGMVDGVMYTGDEGRL